MPVSGVISTIGDTALTLAHRAEEAGKCIIQALINIFRNVLDWIYAFMYRVWDNVMNNPWGAMHLFASFWILMA
ncbi:MAG: hypothetical protein QXH03_10245 [Candidatus Bathyarchaeia archaeon]